MSGIPEEIKMIIYIGFLAGMVLFVYGISAISEAIHSKKLLDKIRNIPKSKIRSIALGLSEIYGKTKTKKEIVAPISKQKCIYYYVEIYTIHKGHWMLSAIEYSNNNFYLDDGTGKILVDPKNAKIKLEVNKIIEGNLNRKVFGNENSLYKGELLKGKYTAKHVEEYKKVKTFLDGISETNKNIIEMSRIMFFIPNEMKLKEYIIKENDEIYILGTVENNNELIIKEGPEKILYINLETETENDKKTIENDKELYKGIIYFILGIIIILYVLNLVNQVNV